MDIGRLGGDELSNVAGAVREEGREGNINQGRAVLRCLNFVSL